MKQLLILILLTASITFAQTKPVDKKADKDSTEFAQIYQKVTQLNAQIKDLQSNLYEAEKQLEALYKDYTLYNNLLKAKKELIEAKKEKKK